jgi:hypothetical protein
MITKTFGYVQPTSTTVAVIATTNIVGANPASGTPKPFWMESVVFQVLKTNTGTILICDTANPNLTTGIGVLFEIPVPNSNDGKSLPAWVVGDPSRSNNPVNVAQFYILPSVSGEGVRVSALRSGTSQNFLS